MHAPPPTLAYDHLPPGSDIRREHHGDAVTITVPAGPVPPGARRAAQHAALVSGAVLGVPMLIATAGLFFYAVRANRIVGPAYTWALAFFAVFCVALVALVTWVRSRMLLEDVQRGRQQTTVLAATPARLLIETRGPYGVNSHDLPRQQIAGISTGRSRVMDGTGRQHLTTRLVVRLTDGREIVLMPGRDPVELRSVAGMLGEVLHV